LKANIEKDIEEYIYIYISPKKYIYKKSSFEKLFVLKGNYL